MKPFVTAGWGLVLETAQAEGVLEQEDEPKDGGGKQKSIDAVENASVAGEHGAGVLDACSTLDGGFQEVAELGGDVQDAGENEGLPERLGDVEEKVAAGREEVAEPDDECGGQDAADDGGDGAFPGFARAEARGQLVLAEGAADVEGGNVSGPDADHEEDDEGGAVFFLPEQGDEGEGVGDPDEAEESLRGVRQDLDERGAKAVPGEESEGDGAEDGKLGFDGEVGQGDDEGERGAEGHPPDGDAELCSVGFGADCGELEVLVGRQFGDDGRGEGDHPELTEEDEREDGEDENECGEDSFHGPVARIHCRGRGEWNLGRGRG